MNEQKIRKIVRERYAEDREEYVQWINKIKEGREGKTKELFNIIWSQIQQITK